MSRRISCRKSMSEVVPQTGFKCEQDSNSPRLTNARRVTTLAVACLFAVGCGAAEDPQVARYRTALQLANPPKDSVTIEDARSNIESVQDVVLTGRIGVPDMPKWWSADTATIYISEGAKDSHYNPGDGHNPATCPFCKRKWKVEDSMAIVNFVDDSGKAVPVSAKKLWGNLKEGDVVMIKGASSLDDEGYLVVESDGLFIRSQ